MGFMDRLQNGWRLMLNSFEVMQKNPRLLLFPVSTAALTMVMAALFVTPIALQPTGHAYTEGAHWSAVGGRLFVAGPPDEMDVAKGRKEHVSLTPAAYAFVAVFYLLSMFLATFFNVAFTHGIFNALDGKEVSVSEGIQFAMTKIRPILMWTLFAGLIGLIIRSLEEKVGFIGKMIVNAVGVAWSVASVFVIPVLVLAEHPDNPIGVVKQSAQVIKKTWGEALAGYAGLQIAGTIVGLGSIFAVIAAVACAVTLNTMLPTVLILLGWVAFIVAFSYVMSVASQIYLCVLYRYAASGTVTPGYTPEMLTMAWRPKKA